MISVNPTTSNAEKLDLENLSPEQTALSIKNLDLFYGQDQALYDISMHVPKNRVTAFIGPSGCGKSTLLRCINRMNDLVEICKVKGDIELHGKNIYDKDVDVAALRRRIGMVFQRPNPFPKSIYENVVYGLRLQGVKDRRVLDEAVETSLRGAALWDEVKDRLNASAFSLSGGQQQRLVIARSIAIEPEILLLDEPTSALDPISTLTIEELITDLKKQFTVVIVTHNMQQAARVSDQTAFLYMGKLIEYADTDTLFTTPSEKQTEDYITGRYG
ncbi:MAG: phosphate ABC transporter ATP-binding protein [Idiomarina sp.]|jgi:phosphate transport system ATP-binding protein|uniref:Phosphate ABC transporter ATP-binding protein (PhoT family) n=1 Tax=Idiomarina aquatica TaxID=1327752 RepID=A0A4V3CPS6_9GAMM|nr:MULTISPECIES: phosphate ABC transporter ATP-binding protein PstB [Idiomarina]MAK71118.1 phosphate ABC transporter ATP-binding protein [Idiomarinaceae bacterium]MBL4742616.1 phosphate ABC transporter ATP-binding protein [Idiomarina sp.]MBT41987.1 phosphate ABC transporter ATP-binding protein [Idiomarina sp.]PHQ75767.1 MAG: phosphate ABC transporter ATP-binding protein [Idiomarina sp.]TDP39195.1 phosphate ABC transporter ATP-binding protein (PhoT family) [Idiomarina aquatica]